MSIPFQQTSFITSAAKPEQCPEDEGREVAFMGRSNAGKSSAINTLTQQNNLAKTSRTPGRTQLLNFFSLTDELRLVDLPGFGFAKVGDRKKKNWQATIDAYLRDRESLVGIVLVMDARHPLKPFDEQMIAWSLEAGMPLHILMTKSDKISRQAQANLVHQMRQHFGAYENLISFQCFSSLKKQGIDALRDQLTHWLTAPLTDEDVE